MFEYQQKLQLHKHLVSQNYMMVHQMLGVLILYYYYWCCLQLSQKMSPIRKLLLLRYSLLQYLYYCLKRLFEYLRNRHLQSTPIVLKTITQTDISQFYLKAIHFIKFRWFIFVKPNITRYNITLICYDTFFANRAGAQSK